MKKIFSVIIAVFMVATLTTKPIFAEDNQVITFNDENFTYKVTSDANKTVSVSKKNLEIETCDIPKTVENNGITYTVTSIETDGFRELKKLKTVNIPDSVTSIGENGFRELTNLKTVNIPDSVTIIGKAAFHKCNQLTSVYIPDSVTTIGGSAFSQCPQLQTIYIPESVTTIGRAAFTECYKLESINLPIQLKIIETDLFHTCPNLKSIVIPSSSSTIGENAFVSSGLTSVVLPNDIGFVDESAFRYCTKINQVLAMQNSSASAKDVSKIIENQILDSTPTYYLGVTDIKAKQTSIDAKPDVILNLNEFFTVSATVKDSEGNPTDTVTVPQEYLQPQYSLVSGATGETRIEDDKLIVDPQQKGNLKVKAILNKQEVELSVNINHSQIMEIKISESPCLTYFVGDTFDPTGLELDITYRDIIDSRAIVEYNENTKNDFEFIVNSPLTLNDNKVIIKYAGFSIELELTVYKKAIDVTPDQNSITGLKEKYEQGQALNVVVKGAGMDNQEPTEGDTRYKPVSWEISTPHQFINDSYEISMDTNSLQLGNHQLKVKFEKQLYNGIEWVTKETFDLEKNFEVVEVSQGEITPTPTPTPTPNTNSTPEETTRTSVVSTEDSTFVIGFVALVVVTGSILFVSFKNKKSKKMQ